MSANAASSGGANSGQRMGQFKSPNEAHVAASLLGVSFNQLNDFVFTFNNLSSSTNARSKFLGTSSSSGSPAEMAHSYFLHQQTSAHHQQMQPLDCLYGFGLGLYNECISLVTNCLNRAFARPLNAPNQPVANCMLLLDPPGFQYQTTRSGVAPNASYADLVCNYVSERLQLAYYQVPHFQEIQVFDLFEI